MSKFCINFYSDFFAKLCVLIICVKFRGIPTFALPTFAPRLLYLAKLLEDIVNYISFDSSNCEEHFEIKVLEIGSLAIKIWPNQRELQNFNGFSTTLAISLQPMIQILITLSQNVPYSSRSRMIYKLTISSNNLARQRQMSGAQMSEYPKIYLTIKK